MRLQIRPPWVLAVLLAAALLTPGEARAQSPGIPSLELAEGQQAPVSPDQEPIFRRFVAAPTRQERRLRIFELPVALRPQTDPLAEASEHTGLGYEVGFRPFDRIYSSLGANWARMAWRPSDPTLAAAEVKQFDVYQSLNFHAGRHVVIGLGLGLGVLDSLVVTTDGRFAHHVVPYVPVRLGVGTIIGDSVWLGLRVVATPFFGGGPTVGQSRLLLGLGWTY